MLLLKRLLQYKSILPLQMEATWAGLCLPGQDTGTRHCQFTQSCRKWKDLLPSTWSLTTFTWRRGRPYLNHPSLSYKFCFVVFSVFVFPWIYPLKREALWLCFKFPLVQFRNEDSEPLESGCLNFIFQQLGDPWRPSLLTWKPKIKNVSCGVTEKLYCLTCKGVSTNLTNI